MGRELEGAGRFGVDRIGWAVVARGSAWAGDSAAENSMDVDPVTTSQAVALLGYEAMIGSEFEKEHGWHVNLMPAVVLKEMPDGWEKELPEKLTVCWR